MKAKLLFPLALCSLLLSCNESINPSTMPSSSEEQQESSSSITEAKSFKEAYGELEGGYSLEGTVSQRTTSGMISYIVDIESNHDFYNFERYETSDANVDPTKDNLFDSLSYMRDISNDLAATAILDISNKISYSYVLNSTETAYLSFDESGFMNAFEIFAWSDFANDGDDTSKYYLDIEGTDYGDALSLLSVQLLGNSTVPLLKKFALIYEDGKIKGYEGTYEAINANSQERTIKGEFLKLGQEVQLECDIKPVEGEEDQQFAKVMDSLKKGNYELTDIYWGITGDETMAEYENPTISTIVSDSKSMVISKYSADTVENPVIDDKNILSKVAYVDHGNSEVSICNVINGKYYQNESRQKGSILSLLSSFDISSLFFNYDESTNTYVYDNVNARATFTLTNTYSPFSPSYSMLGRFEMVLNDDGSVTFNAAYAYPASVEQITYRKIGEVEEINKNDSLEVLTDCTSLSMSELLSNQKSRLDNLTAYLKGEDVVNLIPTLGGTHSLGTLYYSEDYDSYAVEYRLNSIGTSLLTEYEGKLTTAGFEKSGSTGSLFGGEIYTYGFEKDSVGYLLSLEVGITTTSPYTFIISPSISTIEQ